MSDKEKVKNEKVIEADVLDSASVDEPKAAPAPDKTRQQKSSNKVLWLGLLLVLAVSVGGIANLYKKIKVVEDKLVESKSNVAAPTVVSATPQVVASATPQVSVADLDNLSKKLVTLEKQTGEFAATQKILASIPQSVNQEIRKLSTLESKFSGLEKELSGFEKELKKINDAAKDGVDNAALQRARPIIADGIRAAAISFDYKQAALLFQDAAIVLHNRADPQNSLAEQKLMQLSKDLNAAYVPDMAQINTTIDATISKVDSLAFIGDKNLSSDISDAKPEGNENVNEFTMNDLAGNVWNDFKSLVKISKDETGFVAVVSNEARQAYRATILLKLEQAKLMALSAKQQEYLKVIQSTTDMARKVFDTKSAQVKEFIESLSMLSKIKVEPATVEDKLEIARQIIK